MPTISIRNPRPALTRVVVNAFLLFFLVAALPQSSAAQNEVPAVTRAYAIEGATIVTAPGQVITDGTVVVRNGVIESVGSSVAVPYDARVIRGDSLFVYAGFIDGLGHTGIPAPKDRPTETRPDDPGNPSNDRAGIQPQRSASEMLDSEDKAVEDYRKVGFGAAHVVPRGKMLPGTGAVAALGSDVSNGVIAINSSMFAQFVGAGRAYPSTPMGIMAKTRDLYREANREKEWESIYDADPTSIERPPRNAVHQALYPVLEGETSVFMKANDVLQIYRAIKLRDDLGYSLVLAGVEQASEMIEELASSSVPILLTLKLPKEKDADKKGKDSTDSGVAYNPTLRTANYADTEDERENLKARSSLARQRYTETAAALEKAGVMFGFTSIDIKAKDFKKNIRRMIEAGLSEDAALAALTTNAAKILGVDRALGSIESGKMANLVVSSGSYFAEKSFIKYMIVDGELFEYEAPKPKKDGDKSVDFAGVWEYETEAPDGTYTGTLTLKSSGDSYRGLISGEQVPETTVDDVEVDGNTISFSFDVPELGAIRMTMTVTDDSGTGSAEVPQLGEFPVTATRTPDSAK